MGKEKVFLYCRSPHHNHHHLTAVQLFCGDPSSQIWVSTRCEGLTLHFIQIQQVIPVWKQKDILAILKNHPSMMTLFTGCSQTGISSNTVFSICYLPKRLRCWKRGAVGISKEFATWITHKAAMEQRNKGRSHCRKNLKSGVLPITKRLQITNKKWGQKKKKKNYWMTELIFFFCDELEKTIFASMLKRLVFNPTKAQGVLWDFWWWFFFSFIHIPCM